MASPNVIAPKSEYKARWRSPPDHYTAGVNNRDAPPRSPPRTNYLLNNCGNAPQSPPTTHYSPARTNYLLPTGAKTNLLGNACMQRPANIAGKDALRVGGGSPPTAHYINGPARPVAGSVMPHSPPNTYDGAVPKAPSPPQQAYLRARLLGLQKSPFANARSPVKQPDTPVAPTATAARHQPHQQPHTPVDLTRKRWNVDFKESDVLNAEYKAWPGNLRPTEKRHQKLGEDKNADAACSKDVMVEEEGGDESGRRALGMDTLHFDSSKYNAYHAAHRRECDKVLRTQGAPAGSDDWRTGNRDYAGDERLAATIRRFAKEDGDRRDDAVRSSTANGTHALAASKSARTVDHATTPHVVNSPTDRFSHTELSRASARARETACPVAVDPLRQSAVPTASPMAMDPVGQSVKVTVSRARGDTARWDGPLTQEYRDGANVTLRHVESSILSSMSDGDNLSVHSRTSQRSHEDTNWMVPRGSAVNVVGRSAPSTSSQGQSEAGRGGTHPQLDEQPSDNKSRELSEPYVMNKGGIAVAGRLGTHTEFERGTVTLAEWKTHEQVRCAEPERLGERETLTEWETSTEPDSLVVRGEELYDVPASSSASPVIHREESLEPPNTLADKTFLAEQQKPAQIKLGSDDGTVVHSEFFPHTTVVGNTSTRHIHHSGVGPPRPNIHSMGQPLSNITQEGGARGCALPTAMLDTGEASPSWTMLREGERKEHEVATAACEEAEFPRNEAAVHARGADLGEETNATMAQIYSDRGQPQIPEWGDSASRDPECASNQVAETRLRLQSDSTSEATSIDYQHTCEIAADPPSWKGENVPCGAPLPARLLPPCRSKPQGTEAGSLPVRGLRELAKDIAKSTAAGRIHDDAPSRVPAFWDGPPRLSHDTPTRPVRHVSDWGDVVVAERYNNAGQKNAPRYGDRNSGGTHKYTDGAANEHMETDTLAGMQRSPTDHTPQWYGSYGSKLHSSAGRYDINTSKRSPISGGLWISPRSNLASKRSRPSSGSSTAESVADIVARNEKRERKPNSRRDEGFFSSGKLNDSIIVPKPKIAQGEVVLESRKHRDREPCAGRDIGEATFQALVVMEERLGTLYGIADRMESWSRDVLRHRKERRTEEESDNAAFLAKVSAHEDFAKKMCGHTNGSPRGAIRECREEISALLDAFAELLDVLQKARV
eukprot:GEMP01001181.1.p1 GENE.GEMP01001181.1~~GEMP01001181.1.p1  ORF type:complete len:1176 (+),score=286.63 GEMP01001181.1:976-4503(+)